jgi:hypothetical protein
MSAMRREKQYDMFDVATGACTLDDYLFQRYSENDLSSTFWIDKKDEVDELRAPKPNPDGIPGTEPEVVPVQGPRAPKQTTSRNPDGPPDPPEGLAEPEKEPRAARPLSTSAAPPDGLDSLADGTSRWPAPRMESFKTGGTTPVESPETFQSQSEPEQEVGDVSKPPSMEDLLAQFRQATENFNQRNRDPNEDPHT